jgi:hypothetical protein
MVRNIFDSNYKKKRYFDIEMVNFDNINLNGTCKLTYDDIHYFMTWSLTQFPTEVQSLPGSPIPIKVNYTIYGNCDNKSDSLNSMSGEFIYKIPSGTLPNYSSLGIPFGTYNSLAYDNIDGNKLNISLCLNETYTEIAIYKTHSH